MIIASKKPKILASQINTGGAPVVLPSPTPQVFTMGGTAGSSSTTSTPIQTTNTSVTSAPVSGSSGSSNAGANAVSNSISGEAEKDIEYYLKKYWYVPLALVLLYIGSKKYRWF